MSESWPPQQPWPPRQDRSQSPYGPPDPDYPDAGSGYPGAGYGQRGPTSGYGQRGPNSGSGYPRPGQQSQPRPPWQPEQPAEGWPPAAGGGWPQQGSTSRPLYPYAQQPQQQSPYEQYSQYPQYQPYQQDPRFQPDPYGGQYGYDEPRGAGRSRNWLLPVLLVVVLLLVAGGGIYILKQRGATAGGTPATPPGAASSATGTPGIPQGFHAYTDDTAHIRFGIPQGWKTTGSAAGAAATSGLEVMSPDQNSFILVKQYNFTGNNAGAASGALAGAAGSGSVTNKQGPTNVHFAGETWVEESGDATISGTPVHMVILVTTHDNATYLLGYFSVASSFGSANSHYFQPIQNSFTFTK